MLDQYTLIWNTNYKYLIILDACRYDYFEKVYREFPELRQGKLYKVISSGSSTAEWLEKIFQGQECKDIVYISANPYINSKGIPYLGFNPGPIVSRFYKVIDVWNWGWDEELGIVHPREVNKATLIAIRLYPNKRFIIHYLQPHYPYLDLVSKGVRLYTLRDRVEGFIRWRIVDLLGKKWGLKLANKLVGPPPNEVSLVARRVGVEGLRKAYETNLRVVLEHVVRLLNNLHGRIIITSDHGDLLGEHGMYGHLSGKNFPELIQVPWLEISR